MVSDQKTRDSRRPGGVVRCDEETYSALARAAGELTQYGGRVVTMSAVVAALVYYLPDLLRDAHQDPGA